MKGKKIGSLRLGLTFAGCFLGAGYVSGREMWQFFGRFGGWGWLGLCLALGSLGLLGAMTLLLVRRTGEQSLSALVIPWPVPWLRGSVSVFSVVFLFGIDSIMTAGAGALCSQSLGFSAAAGSLGFSLLVALLTLTGLEGMVSAFSLTVPVLTVCTIAISVLAAELLPAAPGAAEGRGWFFAALTFAAYNMFSSVAILAPLGEAAEPRQLRRGVALGTALLLLIAGPILFVLSRNGAAAARELPMLEIAVRLWEPLGYVFALLLLLAMLGTAFSCFLAGFRKAEEVSALVRRYRSGAVFLLSGLVWCASLLGFGTLIDVIYPLFGGCSVIFLGCMVYHYFRASGKKQR